LAQQPSWLIWSIAKVHEDNTAIFWSSRDNLGENWVGGYRSLYSHETWGALYSLVDFESNNARRGGFQVFLVLPRPYKSTCIDMISIWMYIYECSRAARRGS
jgi:hypothetical protein